MAGYISSIYIVILLTFAYLSPLTTAEATWRIRPSNSSVHLGRNVTLFCEISGLSGQYSVIWQKGVDVLFINHARQLASERYHITGQQTSGQFNLLVTGSERGDDHTYRCMIATGSSKAGGLKQDAHLTVIAPPGQPTISREDGTTVLTAGDEVRLKCQSSGGNPAPSVRWYRADQLISGTSVVDNPAKQTFGETTSVLTWRLSASDHNVPFTCTVENSGNQGKPIGSSLRLDVQYGPIVGLNLHGAVKIVENTKLTLKCQVNANPPVATVTWFKGGQRQTESGLQYQIDRVLSSEHSTTYECVASNKIGEGRNQTSIDVIYPPRVSVKEAPGGQIVVNKSTNLHLTCTVDANPTETSVHWRKLGSGSTINGPTLHLYNIQESQAGIYVCEAENSMKPTIGESTTSRGNASVNVVVTYAPGQAEIKQLTAKAVIGQDVTLRCTVDDQGVPAAKFYWSKEGDSTFNFEGVDLTLSSITWNDGGIYACVARNEVGNGLKGRRELKVYEAVSFLPPLLELVKYVKVSDGQLSVMCEVRGEPAPAITWYRNGVPVLPGTAALFTVTVTHQPLDQHSHRVTSQLQWLGDGRYPKKDSLSYEDAGNYTCVAANGIGDAKQRSVNLIVQYPPIIQVPASKVASDLGETVTLTCQCRSLPPPDMAWYLGNKKLSNSGRIAINSTTESGTLYHMTLTISNLGAPDLDLYTCVSGNRLGNSSASVQLMKRGIPESPVNLKVLSITWETTLLQWMPGFDRGYQQFFIVTYKSNNGQEKKVTISSSNVTKYNISGLLPSTRYTFTVSGENQLGRSPPSNPASSRTQHFSIPAPTDVVYSTKDQILRFRSFAANTCVRISLSDNGQTWSLYEPCAPSAGGSVKITTNARFSQVKVSLCLERRQDVCSAPVLAQFVASGGDLSLTVIIAIVCSVIGVLIVMVIVVLVIHCKRRKKASGDKSQDVPDSRLYHQNEISTGNNRSAEPSMNNKQNNTALPSEKTLMIASDRSSYPHPSTQYSEPYTHIQKSWPTQALDPQNFYSHPANTQYNPPGSNPYSAAGGLQYNPPSYPQMNKAQYAYQQNPSHGDIFNNSGESIPSRSSSENTGNHSSYKPDTHSQSSIESGYSTPTKTKKVIREIVV